jgi:hypothetical protein
LTLVSPRDRGVTEAALWRPQHEAMPKRLAIGAALICAAVGVLVLGLTSRAVVEGHAYSIPYGDSAIGSIKQPDGSSIVRFELESGPAPFQPTVYKFRTNRDGAYSATLPPGTYRVKAESPDGTFVVNWEVGPREVVLNPGDHVRVDLAGWWLPQ